MRSIQPLSAISAAALSFVVVIAPFGATLDANPAPAPTYALTAWAAEKGLPPGDVFAIAQDLEGYLWVGTPAGLLRFDGSRFTRFAPENPRATFPTGPVHALLGSSDGGLWVGLGGGGGVVTIHAGEVVRYALADGAPPGATAIIQDRQGTIWAASRRGVFRFSNGKWSTVGQAEGYSGAEAFSLYEDRAGNLWVGSAAGVYRVGCHLGHGRARDSQAAGDARGTAARFSDSAPDGRLAGAARHTRAALGRGLWRWIAPNHAADGPVCRHSAVRVREPARGIAPLTLRGSRGKPVGGYARWTAAAIADLVHQRIGARRAHQRWCAHFGRGA
jgi:Two component regulator propeller